MYPHRSDFTSVRPQSAWFALVGAAARHYDNRDSAVPLVVQSRGWDILSSLGQRFGASYTDWNVSVLNELDAQLATIENGPIDPSLAIHEDLARIAAGGAHPNVEMSARVLQCAIWFALGLDQLTGDQATTPNDVQLPAHAIRPYYATAPIPAPAPQPVVAGVPFRATWYAATDSPVYPIDMFGMLSR